MDPDLKLQDTPTGLKVAILIPSTLRNVNIPPQEIPAKFTLFQQAIPSILSTAEKSSFAIFLGKVRSWRS